MFYPLAHNGHLRPAKVAQSADGPPVRVQPGAGGRAARALAALAQDLEFIFGRHWNSILFVAFETMSTNLEKSPPTLMDSLKKKKRFLMCWN